MVAAEGGHVEIVEELIKVGANVNLKNEYKVNSCNPQNIYIHIIVYIIINIIATL